MFRLLIVAASLLQIETPDPNGPKESSGPWVIDRRVVSQGNLEWMPFNQAWRIDYWLRNDGNTDQIVPNGFVAAQVDGWVSNSRVCEHGTPRQSFLVMGGRDRPYATADILTPREEAKRCRERGVLSGVARGDEAPPDPLLVAAGMYSLPVVIPPGESLRLRLRLEHDHFLYGPYEPLFGPRSIRLELGSFVIRDQVSLDHELNLRRTVPTWPAQDPPPERLDWGVRYSPPHSVHLEAHVPGNASYYFRGHVRYATRMKLSYRYLVAHGTQGDCKVQIVQHKYGPNLWRTLHDGDHEQCLTTVGRWTRVERIFRTEPEATNLSLEFRLLGDIGEMWIDDIVLEPLEPDVGGP